MERRLWIAPILLLGCAHKPEARQDTHQPAQGGPAVASPSAVSGAAAPPMVCQNDMDCGPAQLCLQSRCVDITPGLAECSEVRVHFDFNSALLRPEERPQLERVVRCVKADRLLRVTIEGNADERGTEEYNLALGDQRARAVERYLETLVVSEKQLRTLSFGELRPLCREHNEGCWSQNRRASLKPTLTTN